MFYREDKHGPDPPGGHQRAGRVLLVDRRRDLLRQPRRGDDPVLHLLLDVRLPARRRPRLGGRRQPRARVPARRHRRAHDAQRRGPPARGRPQPRPGRRPIPNCVAYDPTYALRARGDRPGRPAAHVRRAGGRLLLPHGDERELRAPGDAGGRRGGHPARACTSLRAAEGDGPRVQLHGLGHDPARGDRRRRAAARGLRRRRRRLERDELHRAAPRRDGRASAGRCTRPRSRGRPTSSLGSPTGQGPVVAATDYIRAFADQIRPYVPSARTASLGTDGYGRSDFRARAARASSRSTATTSSSPRWARWPRRARWSRPRSMTRSSATASTRTARDGPWREVER